MRRTILAVTMALSMCAACASSSPTTSEPVAAPTPPPPPPPAPVLSPAPAIDHQRGDDCEAEADCPGLNSCVHHADGTASCEVPCESRDDCPVGYRCEEIAQYNERSCRLDITIGFR